MVGTLIPVAISGIAGKFPESDGLDAFCANLYNGVDMVTDCRRGWNAETYGIPLRMGQLNNLDKFDADFFGVHGKLAENMDPRLRFLLEVSHECITDAGINIAELNGSNTGVYVGASGEEGVEYYKRSSDFPSGYGLLGCLLSTLANRLSFTYNLKGPSIPMDTACSSSLLALQQALSAIRLGICDAALVAGAQLLLDPKTTFMFTNLGMTSPDGKCKSFDSTADGYVRSEAAVAVYICKEESARRSYAIIIHAGTNTNGYHENGITYPSGEIQERLLRQVYAEAGVDPRDVGYVEAHGTGTQTGDFEEVGAIARVFCNDRDPDSPLLIGSVKSNMGHSEPASGLCGIAKLVLIAQKRIIPGNLHFSTPNPKIPALVDGRIKVVASNTPFTGDLVAINSFGFGGSNVHLILKFPSEEASPSWSPNLPVIMPLSGRTSQVAPYLEKLAIAKNKMVAPLLHKIHNRDIPGHGFRCFVVVNSQETAGKVRIQNTSDRIKGERRPLWFIFSGMGTDYQGMVNDMMRLRVFRKSIQESTKILRNSNVDLANLLSSTEDETLNDVLNSCLTIIAVQIALVDSLASVGVVPEGMMGHSQGEAATAYADKCLTAEQTLKVALVRGRACKEAQPGAMASIGLSWAEALKQCPVGGISPVCDNSADNVTISGNAELVEEFVEALQKKDIFARKLHSFDMAFHTTHMNPSAEYMREHLPLVIPDPKPRSSKWISTSVPQTESSSDLYRLCSVDYCINNLLAPVRFREAVDLMPANAVAIEVAPHCVLQAILRRSLPPTVVNVGLMSRKAASNCEYFLEALGEVYLAGHNPDFGALYERVKFPLGPSTPMISPAVCWDHSQSWIFPIIEKESRVGGAKIQIRPSSNDKDRIYLDHLIDGRIIFPGAGYMYVAWSALAKREGKHLEQCPVTFKNVRFERSTIISAEGTTELHVSIQPESGDFEVLEGESAVCRGRIKELDSSSRSKQQQSIIDWDEITKLADNSPTCPEEIYRTLRLRGYGHSGVFRAIEKADPRGEWNEIQWPSNWVGFLDCVLQLQLLHDVHQGLFLPIRIQRARFDPQTLLSYMSQQGSQKIPTRFVKYSRSLKAPGFEFSGIKGAFTQRRQHMEAPILSASVHLPFMNTGETYSEYSEVNLTFCFEIAMDNTKGNHFTILEFAESSKHQLACLKLKDRLVPKFPNFDIFIAGESISEAGDSNAQVLSLTELKRQKEVLAPNLIILSQGDLKLVQEFMNDQCFLLCIHRISTELTSHPLGYQTIAQQPGLTLYRRKQMHSQEGVKAIAVQESNFDWIEKVKRELNDSEEKPRLHLYSNSINSGLQGFVRCLHQEGYSQLRCFETLDQQYVIDFDNLSKDLENVMDLDLVYNVYSSGAWGSFTRTTLTSTMGKDSAGTLDRKSFAHVLQPGDLSSIRWIQSPLDFKSPDGDPILCEVCYSALNFRDVMLATGKLSRDALPREFAFTEGTLGLDYSGLLLKDGTPVFGIQAVKCLATTLEIKEELGFMIPVPRGWTLAEAATVSIAYATAYYALIVKGKIGEGKTVLIHSGAGGVGQAAVAVALSRKCRVITTVSTEEKREFLKGRFPQLLTDDDESFADSRDPAAFEDHVMRVTNGEGVDVVLNSLSGESLQASVRCLGSGGRFLEIGKFDLFNNSELGMELFLRSIEFHGVLLDNLYQSKVPPTALEEKARVKELMLEGIASGEVAPLPYTEFPSDQVEDAFRFMTQGNHMGKVLVKIRDEPRAPANIPALPRVYFYPHKLYILVGGLGGMGLEIADWIITRGARHLLFVSRSDVRSWYQNYRVFAWQAKGAAITISNSDVTTPEGVRSIFEAAQEIGPIGGIFNLAVELKDALFVDQTVEDFEIVAKPKIRATLLLDQFTRELEEDVDYFVVFSSVTVLAGNAGQSNYGFANSVIERVCERRRAAGRHGLAIQWGPIGEVGIYHSVTGGAETPIAGCAPQRISSVLDVLDALLSSSAAVVSSFIPASASSSSKEEGSGTGSLSEVVARVLGIRDLSSVRPEDPFTSLGMDSLMVTEIKQLLERKLGVSVPTATIMSMSFAKLGEMELSSSSSASITNEEQVLKLNRTPLILPERTLLRMESQQTKPSNLFLVHPIEGNLRMLAELVKDLDCSVYGLECTPDAPLSSIPALAAHYVQSMKSVQAKGPYTLAGYSYGGAVAFEMGLQLEAQGEALERLVLLDSSPQMQRLASQTISKNLRSSGDTTWLVSFLLLYSDQKVEQVEAELDKMSTWEAKLDFVVDKLAGLYPTLLPEDIKSLALALVKRLSAGNRYTPRGKIKGETVLVRAGRSGYDTVLGQDYGLNGICDSQVKVFVVDGDHHCFCDQAKELRIARIINDIIKL